MLHLDLRSITSFDVYLPRGVVQGSSTPSFHPTSVSLPRFFATTIDSTPLVLFKGTYSGSDMIMLPIYALLQHDAIVNDLLNRLPCPRRAVRKVAEEYSVC